VEQQMKLHIEVLQEKVESLGKERDEAKRDMDKAGAECRAEVEKLTKIVKTLEEELTAKAERIKSQEAKLKEAKDEA
jgi:predicted  nucleic acid-binding Zn-ribbon protein